MTRMQSPESSKNSFSLFLSLFRSSSSWPCAETTSAGREWRGGKGKRQAVGLSWLYQAVLVADTLGVQHTAKNNEAFTGALQRFQQIPRNKHVAEEIPSS